jgi:hypothetical protein
MRRLYFCQLSKFCFSNRFYFEKQQENINKKSKILYQTFQNYQRGIIGGIGMFTGLGTMLYFFWPTVQNKSSNTATNILQDEDVQKHAISLTKNITEDLLKDQKTLELLCELLLQMLQKESTRKDLINLIKSIYEDQYTQEITKKFIVDIINDKFVSDSLTNVLLVSSTETLKKEEFHKSIATAAKKSIWKIF